MMTLLPPQPRERGLRGVTGSDGPRGSVSLFEGTISQSFTITHSRTHFSANQQVYCKFSAKNQESDAAWVRVSGFCVRAVCAQLVPRRVRVKADACAAFRMGSPMVPTSLGHSWKGLLAAMLHAQCHVLRHCGNIQHSMVLWRL